jgi:sulfate permease, SulP family
MGLSNKAERRASWLSYFPSTRWLANYQSTWLQHDLVAGITLAAYAMPVSLAYAALAGSPARSPQWPPAMPSATSRSPR